MAVLGIVTSNDLTRENYEVLRPLVRWETDLPTGGIFHSCAFDDNGVMHVVDVWESAEHMETFFKSRLLPALEKLGIQPPQVELYQLHNCNAFPAIAQYFAKNEAPAAR